MNAGPRPGGGADGPIFSFFFRFNPQRGFTTVFGKLESPFSCVFRNFFKPAIRSPCDGGTVESPGYRRHRRWRWPGRVVAARESRPPATTTRGEASRRRPPTALLQRFPAIASFPRHGFPRIYCADTTQCVCVCNILFCFSVFYIYINIYILHILRRRLHYFLPSLVPYIQTLLQKLINKYHFVFGFIEKSPIARTL